MIHIHKFRILYFKTLLQYQNYSLNVIEIVIETKNHLKPILLFSLLDFCNEINVYKNLVNYLSLFVELTSRFIGLFFFLSFHLKWKKTRKMKNMSLSALIYIKRKELFKCTGLNRLRLQIKKKIQCHP